MGVSCPLRARASVRACESEGVCGGGVCIYVCELYDAVLAAASRG